MHLKNHSSCWTNSWLNDKTYTAGVPANWILDFNAETFNPITEDDDQSYVAQWRESKSGKIPKRGWKFYDAKVIKVSNNLKSLERELDLLDGDVSPLRPERPDNESIEHSGKRNLEFEYDKKQGKGKRSKDETSRTSTSYETPVVKKSKPTTVSSEVYPHGQTSHRNVPREKTPDLESHDSDNFDDVVNDQSHPEDDRSLKQILLNLSSEDIKLVKRVQLNMLRAQEANPARQTNQQVEIGHQGSNVFVTQQQWDTANSRDTYWSMGVSLIHALFDTEVLLESNLRGGLSKIDKNAPKRSALNPHIVTAITGKP
ncbi:Protein of unknown function [Cotesia congregata]|uniref:Uncharacterized protein n=1 Tax=Cotesia congregata TaxID=51543 RepID=A0A8J2HFJ2_COTCN|nr:Protein of unknown function [Cotesia congregata]